MTPELLSCRTDALAALVLLFTRSDDQSHLESALRTTKLHKVFRLSAEDDLVAFDRPAGELNSNVGEVCIAKEVRGAERRSHQCRVWSRVSEIRWHKIKIRIVHYRRHATKAQWLGLKER